MFVASNFILKGLLWTFEISAVWWRETRY